MSRSSGNRMITSPQTWLQCGSCLLWKAAVCTAWLSSSRTSVARGVIKVTIKQEPALLPSVTRSAAAVWGRNLFSFALPLPECNLIGVTAAIPELCWCNRARSGPQPAPEPQGIAAKMDWLTLQVHFHVNVLALAPVNIGWVICTVLHVWWHTQWVTAPNYSFSGQEDWQSQQMQKAGWIVIVPAAFEKHQRTIKIGNFPAMLKTRTNTLFTSMIRL